MKVIFLDFDGVVNDVRKHEVLVNPIFVNELKKLISVTQAKVVVTSNQRDSTLVFCGSSFETSLCYKEYVVPFMQMGIEIYGYTPFVNAKEEEKRELEIESYLEAHPEITDFVIIEDDYVMQRLYDHQVFIEYSDGFVSKYVEPAVRILNGDLGFYPPDYDRSESLEDRVKRIFSRGSMPFIFEEMDPLFHQSGSQSEDLEQKLILSPWKLPRK